MIINGKIIVIEGTDGSGKQTQTKLLKQRLEQLGRKVYSTSFPNYSSDSSGPVRMYLKGELSKNANEVSAKAASIMYATDRYATYMKEIKPVYDEDESIIVFDRWSSSNIIHQGGKLISNIQEAEQRRETLTPFITWLDNLEHEDFGIPRADTTIYLYVPLEYTIKLRKNRANKITGGEKQDIHESDNEHLKNASEAGLTAARLLGWEIIDCVRDDKMRSIEDISEEIWQRITKSK